jgi:transcriptional regulator with PAS, ATPase and Fis domain
LFLHKTQTLLERQRQDSTQLRRVRVLVYLQKTEIFLELNEIAQAAHALTQAEALLLQSEESSDLQPVLAKLRLSLAEAEGHPQKIEDALVQFTHLSKVAPTTDTHRAERQLVNREQETPMNQATQVISSSDPSSSELKQILEMNKILSLARSNEELIQSMLSQATLLSGAEASALFLAGSGPLTLAATFPAQSASIFSLQTAQECLSTKEALRVADAQNDERTQRFESVQKMGLKSLLYLPLISPRQTWGVLAVSHHTGVHRFNQTLEYQMRLFADQAVLVWERLQQEINLETHLRATQKALEQSEKEAEAYESLWRQNRGQTRLDQLVGQSACMQALKEKVHRLADTPLSITLQGPSGSGKELVARSLHELSSRKKNPFIAINCGALPAHLIESELFGHRAGSFTGAHRDKKGLFELAQGGTLFLDEIGDLETSLQVKLLRALQEREIRRVGDEKCIPIDIRVIAATCRNLEHEMNQGRFRDDLYYRIAEVRLDLPSLAERREDIPDLVHFFISDFFGKKKKPVLERALLERWMQHRWPGNVRQLASQVRVACALSDGTKLRLQDWLLTQTHSAPQPAVASPSPIALPPKAVNTVQEEPTATEWLNALIDAPMNWEEIESRVFSAVFQQTDQDLKKAAHRLKISSSTLYGWQRKSKKRKTDSKPETAPKLSLRLDDIKTYCIQRVQKQTEDAYRTANQLGLSPATVYKWLKESPKVRAN